MNILRIARRTPPLVGGLESHVADLSWHQAEAGHHVELVFSAGGGVPLHERIRLRQFKSPTLDNISSSLSSIVFLSNVIFRLREPAPLDLIHLHGDWPEAFLGSWFGRKFGTPTLLTIHGGLSNSFRYRLLASRGLKAADQIIAVSQEIVDKLIKLGLEKDRISLIPSGIRYEDISSIPRERGSFRTEDGRTIELSGHKLVLAVGRLHPVKGYGDLVSAARILLPQRNDVIFAVAGDGPDRRYLETLAEGLKKFYFLGNTDRPRIYKLLRAADLFAHPAVDLHNQREGNPTALTEAMAAGLPVVATRSGGIPYLLDEGKGALLVSQRMPHKLASAIKQLLDNPNFRKQMGTYNQSAIRKRDWKEIALRVSEVSDALIKTWGS